VDSVSAHPRKQSFETPVIVCSLLSYLSSTVKVLILIYDVYLSKAKSSLYAPLGVFLFCAFANKRFIRTSFFARISTPPPRPWVMAPSLLGRSIFRNSEDGSVAQGDSDPRFRVPIKRLDYITQYNATASKCDEYWGHRGRKHSADFRIRPVVYRFAFLGLSFGLFAKGVVSIFNYPTHAYDDELKRPDLTADDLERQLRIMYLKLKLMTGAAPLVLFILFYTLFWASRLCGLWVDVMMKYTPTGRREPDRQIQL